MEEMDYVYHNPPESSQYYDPVHSNRLRSSLPASGQSQTAEASPSGAGPPITPRPAWAQNPSPIPSQNWSELQSGYLGSEMEANLLRQWHAADHFQPPQEPTALRWAGPPPMPITYMPPYGFGHWAGDQYGYGPGVNGQMMQGHAGPVPSAVRAPVPVPGPGPAYSRSHRRVNQSNNCEQQPDGFPPPADAAASHRSHFEAQASISPARPPTFGRTPATPRSLPPPMPQATLPSFLPQHSPRVTSETHRLSHPLYSPLRPAAEASFGLQPDARVTQNSSNHHLAASHNLSLSTSSASRPDPNLVLLSPYRGPPPPQPRLVGPQTERRRPVHSRPRRSMASRSAPNPRRNPDDDEESRPHSSAESFPEMSYSRRHTGPGRRPPEPLLRQIQVLRSSWALKFVASKKFLQSMQSVEIDELPETERSCVICYNEFGVQSPEGVNEAPLRLPKCKHVFGDHCIKKWFEDSDNCPYCRDKVHAEPRPPNSATRALMRLMRAQGINLPAAFEMTGDTMFLEVARQASTDSEESDASPEPQAGNRRAFANEDEDHEDEDGDEDGDEDDDDDDDDDDEHIGDDDSESPHISRQRRTSSNVQPSLAATEAGNEAEAGGREESGRRDMNTSASSPIASTGSSVSSSQPWSPIYRSSPGDPGPVTPSRRRQNDPYRGDVHRAAASAANAQLEMVRAAARGEVHEAPDLQSAAEMYSTAGLLPNPLGNTNLAAFPHQSDRISTPPRLNGATTSTQPGNSGVR